MYFQVRWSEGCALVSTEAGSHGAFNNMACDSSHASADGVALKFFNMRISSLLHAFI